MEKYLGKKLDKPFTPFTTMRWDKVPRRFHSGYHPEPDYAGRLDLPWPGEGLMKCDRDKALDGYVFYSPDHSERWLLIDMDGEIVHEWPAWGSHVGVLLPNGHVLQDTEFSATREYGLVELDWDGNEVWTCPAQVHHDFHRSPVTGNTFILCHHLLPKEEHNIRDGRILDSYVIEVTPDREVVWEWYGKEHTEELTRLEGIQFPNNDFPSDWTHTNTVWEIQDTPAKDKNPAFKPGNIIVNPRKLNVVCVIDKDSGEIIWTWGSDVMDNSHATILLDNGNLLIFDNGAYRWWSQVIEVDVGTGEIVWKYKTDPPELFCGRFLSNAQRLPNGNTFICSGFRPDHGKLFEVTPEGEVVWEWYNAYAEYCVGSRNVYRAYKYPKEFIHQFLKK